MFRRHPLLATLAVLFLLALAGITTFLATFDLDRYREQLQTRMSAALSQPVQLGEAGFSLRHGPAFSFADLRVGAGDGEAGVLRADHLLLKIELLPLLKGDVTFSSILLDAPHFSYTLNPSVSATEADPASALRLDRRIFENALIRSLAIHDGTLNLLDRRDPEHPFSITIEHLDAKLSNISLRQRCRLKLAGKLAQDGASAAITLAGTVDASKVQDDWRPFDLDLELQVDNLTPEPFRQRYAAGLSRLQTAGTLSVGLALQGSPATGLRLTGKLDSSKLQVRLPSLYRSPLHWSQINFEGVWTHAAADQKFTSLSLQADGLTFAGAATLEQRDAQPWLTAELTSGELPLRQLLHFLPDQNPPEALPWLRKSLGGGTAEIVSAHLSAPLADFGRLGTGAPLPQSEIRVRDGILNLEHGGPLRAINFVVRLGEDSIGLQNGSGRFLEAPFHFSGSLTKPFAGTRDLRLDAGGTLPLPRLMELLPKQRLEKIDAAGSIPLKLKIEGPAAQLTFDLQADLQAVDLRWDKRPVKASGEPGNFFLTGILFPERFELSHSRLQLPPLEIRSRGSIDRNQAHPFHLNLDLAPLPLSEILPFVPVLDRFAIRGEASGQFDVTGAEGKIRSRSGTLILRGFGMHLAGAVADISDANGEFRLRDDDIDFEHVSARLGISPVLIDGSLRNFSDPRLELHVRAKTIRADDLIFPSDKLVLRDVDGRLVIDKGGILFNPVKVRLNGGTAAVVAGALKDFSAPQVNLDIEAERANIDEVIALWQRSQETTEVQPSQKQEKGNVTVLIDARVREGVLGPLNFQNAEGQIGYVDGTLTIFPLRFDAGAGRCTGQVQVSRQADGSSLLKMSGHLENFDAAAVQHEILKMRGLITGTLKGDFYLEGEPGSNFLRTSLGGFSLQIKNGVLRKFPFLAKVFSLLNVSQLLTLNLPDMSQEGMPFNRLKANLSLKQGILATDDLFVDSNAMNLSLIGNADLARKKLDLLLGVKPLRTVDKIVSQIPIAGWLLTGDEKALITAHFEIKGNSEDPDVTPVPITSISEKAVGIFKRVLGLPGKVITDVGEMLQGQEKK